MKQLASIALFDAVLFGLVIFTVLTRALPTLPVAIAVFVTAMAFNTTYLYRNFAKSRRKCGGEIDLRDRNTKDSAIITRAKRNNPSSLKGALVLLSGGLTLLLASAILRLYAHDWNLPDGIRLIWSEWPVTSSLRFTASIEGSQTRDQAACVATLRG
jgi:hypothetical protein